MKKKASSPWKRRRIRRLPRKTPVIDGAERPPGTAR